MLENYVSLQEDDRLAQGNERKEFFMYDDDEADAYQVVISFLVKTFEDDYSAVLNETLNGDFGLLQPETPFMASSPNQGVIT